MCEVFVPIYWGKADTLPTIRAIKTHNSVWIATCGKIKRPAEGEMPERHHGSTHP